MAGHPQYLCGHMLSAGEMIFLWFSSSLDPAFFLISWPYAGQLKLGASLLRIEVVSLEIKEISGD